MLSPRGGKPIEGPSNRLAEIVAYAWGNLRISSRITNEGAKFLTAQTTILDLEHEYRHARSKCSGVHRSKWPPVQRRHDGGDGKRRYLDFVQECSLEDRAGCVRDPGSIAKLQARGR